MPLEPTFHTRVRIIDLDGTVLKKKAPKDYFSCPTEALPGAIEKIQQWFFNGDVIIFWTARPIEYRNQTLKTLDDLGFYYHDLICGKPYTHEMHIYDDNVIISHRVTRDVGIGELNNED